jgi:hypothetical protein
MKLGLLKNFNIVGIPLMKFLSVSFVRMFDYVMEYSNMQCDAIIYFYCQQIFCPCQKYVSRNMYLMWIQYIIKYFSSSCSCSPNDILSCSLLMVFFLLFSLYICGRDNKFARDKTFWVAFEEIWCIAFHM